MLAALDVGLILSERCQTFVGFYLQINPVFLLLLESKCVGKSAETVQRQLAVEWLSSLFQSNTPGQDTAAESAYGSPSSPL